MSYYRTCPVCGAHLDPGEKCDCEKYTYFENTTKGGTHYAVMEIKEGETPIVNVSEVFIIPDGGYVMHIARPEDRAACFCAVLMNESGNGCEVIETMGKYECILKIDHREEAYK